MWHLFSAKCGTDLLRGALLARFVLIMGINAQRHIDRGVSCEISDARQRNMEEPCHAAAAVMVLVLLPTYMAVRNKKKK